MTESVDYEKLVPVEEMTGEDENEGEQLKSMLKEAEAYLASYSWCHSITREFYGLGVAGVVAVFFFEIAGDPGVDSALWVVCGDLPSAYLVTDEAKSPCAALEVYCGLMEEWITAVRGEGAIADVFPVDAEASETNASSLERRVAFLRNEVIPAFEGT
jgi:hypothetical protein